MEFGLENTDMQHLKENDSNVGHGLGMFLRQNGLVKSSNQSQGGQAKVVNTSGASIGANTISKANGILTEEGLHQVSGWTKSFKGSAMKETVKDLNRYHEAMNSEVSVTDAAEILGKIEDIFIELVKDVRWFIRDGSRIYKKEAAALRPVMSSLLIQLYSLGNVFDRKENIAYDYLMENGLTSARVGDIIAGRGAMSVQGNMVSTGIESGQIDRTAQQMNEWDKNGKPKADWLQELKSRRLPTLGDSHAAENLERIAKMLDDIELQSENSIQREDLRTQFFDITKMIHLLLANPGLMTRKGVEKLKSGKMSHEKADLLNTAEFFQSVAGMTVQEATEKLDEIRQSKAETADQDSIVSGGALSQVFIDTKKNRVLRTSKEKGGIKEQKAKNNFNYDEAMSRLGEITGLGGQAGARTTYYKDKAGDLQYGTNMDMAGGKRADQAKLSFGDAQADSQMKAGRYNIFGHSSDEELQKNASLIISSFNMQIIDYISKHRDRHNENYFIDLNAKDPEQAFVGIDNDNVFGLGTLSEREDRTVSYADHASGKNDASGLYKGYMDVSTELKGFDCIPKETAARIAGLDEKKIEEGMKPYLDRAARFALLRRVRKLKEYVSNAHVVDIRKADGTGMELFKKETMGIMAQAFMTAGSASTLFGSAGAYTTARFMPGILLRTLAMQYFGIGKAAKEKNSEEYKYYAEFEYMTEGESVEDYFGKGNQKNREQKLWNTFEAVIRAAGMTDNEEYKALKKEYQDGKKSLFI